jgi:acid stress chaperone HdeB
MVTRTTHTGIQHVMLLPIPLWPIGASRQERKQVMKNANYMLFGVLVAVPSATGLAQTTIDVAKITCEQLVLMKVADPDHIAIWLSGYYNGKRNTTTVDVEQLKDTATKVRSYCLYNKGTVMEAVESLTATTK